MTFIGVRTAVALAAFGLLAGQVRAQVVIVNPPTVVRDAAPDSEALWEIAPDGAEVIAADTPLKKNVTVLRQRLLPKQLAVLAADAERADGGDRWAAAGDQLFGARVGDLDALCVIKTKLNITVGMFLMPKPSQMLKQDCFVDTDDDGMLDQRFEADPGIGTLPNVARARPGATQPLAPVGFELRNPAEFSDESWVEIRYRGDGLKPGKPARFEVRYRYDGKTRDLTDEYRATSDGEAQVLELLGARIVISASGKDRLSAKVERTMDSDFGVSSSLVYR